MKAWRLNTRASLYALEGEPPAPVLIGERWCSGAIVPETTADIAPAPGLRSAVPVTIRARWSPLLRAGHYLSTAAGDLWHIDSVRDPDGRRTDVLCTCTALDGEPATVTPAVGAPYPVRAALAPAVSLAGDWQRQPDARHLVEVAAFECPPLQKSTRLSLRGVEWRIVGLVDDGDDGVTRRYWVTR